MKLSELTSREFKILRLLCAGKTNKQIAVDMYVCEKTVEFHLGKLYTKSGARTRMGTVIWAIQHGLEVEKEAEKTRDSPS